MTSARAEAKAGTRGLRYELSEFGDEAGGENTEM